MSERDWHLRAPRPTSVKVGAHVWAVRYDPRAIRKVENHVNTHLHGTTQPVSAEILINDLGLPEDFIRGTLLHEVLHAIWWTFHVDATGEDREEDLVARLEAPLLGVLRDNPLLVNYLTDTGDRHGHR